MLNPPKRKQTGTAPVPFRPIFLHTLYNNLLVVLILTVLIGNTAGCLACTLAGCLALAAAALLNGIVEIFCFDGLDSFHDENLRILK